MLVMLVDTLLCLLNVQLMFATFNFTALSVKKNPTSTTTIAPVANSHDTVLS